MNWEKMLEEVERIRFAVGPSNREIAVIDWGGDGPLALLHHANGFCAALWEAVALDLRGEYRVVAMDARGQGDSDAPPGPDDFSWSDMADDLIAVAEALLRETGHERVGLGLGHSFGGTLTLAAAARRHGLFERIALVDPVILPKMTRVEAEERSRQTGLTDRARRRRTLFPNREVARRYFASKDLFVNWQERALDLYVAEAMRDRPDGQAELKCSGSVESAVFAHAHTLDIFAEAETVTCPARIFHATRDSFPVEIHEAIAEQLPVGSIERFDGGHLVPMESPRLVSRAVRRFAAQTSAGS